MREPMRTNANKPDQTTRQLFKFVSKKEIALMVGLHPRSIDNLMQRGLPHLKIGLRVCRFDPDEVAAWMRKEFHTARIGKEGA